jgi:hypothetical protein
MLMNSLIKYLIVILLSLAVGCQPDTPVDPDGTAQDPDIGTVEFDFPVPLRVAPASGIRRIDLSIAKTTYDLYRGDFLISANVSDKERVYSFKLVPGDYYFQAGITCTCMGDTCLWDGFPGGRLGTKWAMDRITIIKGEKLVKKIAFN